MHNNRRAEHAYVSSSNSMYEMERIAPRRRRIPRLLTRPSGISFPFHSVPTNESRFVSCFRLFQSFIHTYTCVHMLGVYSVA